jgi:hypothetical protein
MHLDTIVSIEIKTYPSGKKVSAKLTLKAHNNTINKNFG